MKTSSLLLSTALLASALLLSACGGGGSSGGSGGGTGTATLRGAVVLRDGTTQNLGGVLIRDLRTGQTVVSGANGGFAFGSVPAGTVGLQVIDPATTLVARAPGSGGGDDPTTDDGAARAGADDPPGHDDGDDHGNDGDADEDPDHDVNDDDAGSDGDDDDTGDDDFDLSGVDDGDVVEVEIEVSGGRVTAVRLAQSRLDRERSEVRLTRAATSDDADVTGKARLESRSDRQRFDVEAEDVAAGRILELFVLDLAGLAESQGLRTADAFGEAEWELHSNDGDRLPFGVSAVADLEGFGVEVRDGSGLVLLTGTLPSLPPAAGPATGTGDDDEQRGRARLTRVTAAAGEAYVELESRPEDGRESFKVEVSGQTPPLSIQVWLAHPSTGVLTNVGTFGVGSLGSGEFELDTHDGDALPFGAASVSTLVGKAIELRNASGGAVLFSGTTPALIAH